MKLGDSIEPNDIALHIRINGYVQLPSWRTNETTITVGRSLGAVVDLRDLLPRSSIPTVQILQPRNKSRTLENQYSGSYGMGEFPLHTDLAHWARPPRYMVLRWMKGVADVATMLLPSSAVTRQLGSNALKRALARPRRAIPNRRQCLLPLSFSEGHAQGFRWDPLFLIPMNGAAQQVEEIMSANAWSQADLIVLKLVNPGDTLILDNWRFLHGRSKVSPSEVGRRLERVYLSELQT